MLNRLYNTGKSRQSARPKLRTLNRAEVSAALAASQKQIADLKVEHPGLFKEWSRKEYHARNIHETNISIVVELEHPPEMDRGGYPATSQGGVTTFEISKNESGTLATGSPRIVLSQNSIRNQSILPASAVDRNAAYAAWLIALAWWCEQLKERLKPPSTSALLRPSHEPVVMQEPREQPASGPQQRLDSTRLSVEAIESHAVTSPAPPPARVVGSRKGAAPTENLIPVSASSEERAETVARIIAELNTLEPQMYGEASYEDLKENHPDFLTFAVSEQRDDLKVLLVNIQASKRHIRLAQQCAAHYHGKRFPTIKDDWKHHKPENFRSNKARKGTSKS